MSFESLNLDHGMLGSKNSDRVRNIPESIVKLIDEAWQYSATHPDHFHRVVLSTTQERDEFVLFGKAAAKAHVPELDYRKLPRPAEVNDPVAYFTLREVTPDMVRPGRPAKK